MKTNFLPQTVLSVALFSAFAAPAYPADSGNLMGDPAPASAAGQSINITPDTQYVNVEGGTIVKFVVGKQAFAWNFDGQYDNYAFDLKTVAPPGVLGHSVEAYVSRNPYRF